MNKLKEVALGLALYKCVSILFLITGFILTERAFSLDFEYIMGMMLAIFGMITFLILEYELNKDVLENER